MLQKIQNLALKFSTWHASLSAPQRGLVDGLIAIVASDIWQILSGERPLDGALKAIGTGVLVFISGWFKEYGYNLILPSQGVANAQPVIPTDTASTSN